VCMVQAGERDSVATWLTGRTKAGCGSCLDGVFIEGLLGGPTASPLCEALRRARARSALEIPVLTVHGIFLFLYSIFVFGLRRRYLDAPFNAGGLRQGLFACTWMHVCRLFCGGSCCPIRLFISVYCVLC
jgi:hypothetical protein